MEQIVVAARFNGPRDSGNGGYTCGLVAAATGLPHPEVTLRRPPPLDTPLRVEGMAVYDGEHVVAAAEDTPDAPPLTPPPFPGYDTARAAQQRYAGLRDHPFPTCYVCGPARDDGLGLHPGPVGDGHVACTWVPRNAEPEQVWAALDCPGAWGLLQTEDAPIVLGRLAVTITGTVHAGQPHVVTGWRAAPRDGRKHYAGSALYDAAGTLLATGRATWIALQSPGSAAGT